MTHAASRRGLLALPLAACLAGSGRAQPAVAPAMVRVGALRFGTVNWVLDVARHHGLAEARGVGVEVVELAGTPATQVALQSGRVDVIVADWLWAARLRAGDGKTEGRDLTFAPFSAALGALLAAPGSPVHSAADLRGARLGVAGSPLDKSWLLLRLLCLRAQGFDPQDAARPAFGAPPLLNEQLAAGRLDAVLTYWPFAARLEARGMRAVLPMRRVLAQLGFPEPPPMVGWTFSERWATDRAPALAGFLGAMRAASGILAESDAEWERIAPLTGAADAAELGRLREHFRDGVPRLWGAPERAEAARLHALLAEIGGERLVGPATALPPGTFHAGPAPA